MSDDFNSLEAEIRQRVTERDLFGVEKVLGLARYRFLEILDEPSDWSFVIKLAVILEAALTQVLASRLATPELQKHLARLSIDGRTGKLQLAEDLGVLDRYAIKRVRAIFALRNLFAHDVTIMDKSLASIVDSMSMIERNDLANVMLRTDENAKTDGLGNELVGAHARLLIWLGSAVSLSQLTRAFDQNEASQRWLTARALAGDAFFAKQAGDPETYRDKLRQAISTLEGHNNTPPAKSAA
jgi:hypothetical protein